MRGVADGVGVGVFSLGQNPWTKAGTHCCQYGSARKLTQQAIAELLVFA